ncbi:MAG TPA: hypothetical protein VK841_03470 [Polyangiaceae bacterium]|jgi:hypothetical protein|nr:hypothetical protein [Polyangiaceae bacterium]
MAGRSESTTAIARVVVAVLALASPAACGARSGLDELPPAEAAQPSACPQPAPTCILPSTDPCGESTAEPSTCVDSAWACPPGGRRYARAPALTQTCLPFRGALAQLGPWGLGDFARIPTDDGRCLWVSNRAVLEGGSIAYNVAFAPDLTAPFGTCPSVTVIGPIAVTSLSVTPSNGNIVQITGGYRLGGTTHVLYRIFGQDRLAPYGLTNLGGGVGEWDQAQMAIDIVSTEPPLPLGPDLSLGDAMLPAGDGEHEYVWGCVPLSDGSSGPNCRLARLDADDNVELWSAPAGVGTAGIWELGIHPSGDTPAFFSSGPWISSIVPAPAGLMHVYDDPFGNAVLTQRASTATGSWTDGPALTPCDLPMDDPGISCAGAVVHPELADPTVPNELVVSYSVGTTTLAPPTTNVPDRYWPRLVWVH